VNNALHSTYSALLPFLGSAPEPFEVIETADEHQARVASDLRTTARGWPCGLHCPGGLFKPKGAGAAGAADLDMMLARIAYEGELRAG